MPIKIILGNHSYLDQLSYRVTASYAMSSAPVENNYNLSDDYPFVSIHHEIVLNARFKACKTRTNE